MRVTDLTKQNAIIRNIASNSERLQTIQDNMATGRRITKLSDDPVAATQVQDFRTRISFMDTLQRNIQNNFIWMDRTEAELALMGDKLRSAKTLMLSQANASGDEATRRIAAEELKAITDGILNAANAKIGKLYIFSGSKTFTKPLERNDSFSKAFAIVGDQQGFTDRAIFEGNSANSYIVRITREGGIGEALFKVSDDDGETWSREKTLLPQNEVNNERGKPSDKLLLRLTSLTAPEGQDKLIFPEGMDFVFFARPPITYHGNTDHRFVETGEGTLLPLNVTAREALFKKEGDPDTLDVFNLLFGLRRSLLDNDQFAIEERLDDLDLAFNQVLEARADIGAVRKEMDERLGNLDDREFSKMEQLSSLEDLDFAKASVDMNIADARHKATLDTSGRLIQPSLLNFLR